MRGLAICLVVLLVVNSSVALSSIEECVGDVKSAVTTMKQIRTDWTEKQIVDLAHQMFNLLKTVRGGAEVCRNVTQFEVMKYLASRFYRVTLSCLTETYHLLMEAKQLQQAVESRKIVLTAQEGYKCFQKFKLTAEACKGIFVN